MWEFTSLEVTSTHSDVSQSDPFQEVKGDESTGQWQECPTWSFRFESFFDDWQVSNIETSDNGVSQETDKQDGGVVSTESESDKEELEQRDYNDGHQEWVTHVQLVKLVTGDFSHVCETESWVLDLVFLFLDMMKLRPTDDNADQEQDLKDSECHFDINKKLAVVHHRDFSKRSTLNQVLFSCDWQFLFNDCFWVTPYSDSGLVKTIEGVAVDERTSLYPGRQTLLRYAKAKVIVLSRAWLILSLLNFGQFDYHSMVGQSFITCSVMMTGRWKCNIWVLMSRQSRPCPPSIECHQQFSKIYTALSGC